MDILETQQATCFTQFANPVHEQYSRMAEDELYKVEVEDIAAKYLAAFPEGTNPFYRERTEHDCSTCKQFIRKLGNVVGIEADGNVTTVWDRYDKMPYPYNVVAKELQGHILAAPIVGFFRTKELQFGCDHNYDAEGERYNHFHGRVADRHRAPEPGPVLSELDSRMKVFKRGLEEIRAVDIETILDLIAGNGLYRGEEHKAALVGFQALQCAYEQAESKDLYVWANCQEPHGRFRNTVIGTLLVELAKGTDLEEAVRKFEAMVAPANYKRPTAVITPRMVEAAQTKLEELGLEQAIERRVAKLDDVHVNDVLFVDRAVKPKMKGGITDLLLSEVKAKPVNLKGATEITGDEFLSTVVPLAKSIAVLLENKHLGNLVTLTAPVHESTGRLFKWDNDFAWSYDGDVADGIKQRVKAAGGKVDALFRTSLAWSNYDDLDIHVKTPGGHHIYYGNKMDGGGQLDIDMNAGGKRSRSPVENIYWNTRQHIVDGAYLVQVNNFSKRESIDVGFTLEVEFDGVASQFSYAKAVRNRETIDALAVTVKNGRLESIKAKHPDIVGGDLATDKWGLTTGQLVPVNTLMLSPNYWQGQGVGNKHLIFMLRGCKNPNPVRGIYNEFLRAELNENRKVFEVLGSKAKAQPSDDGLSGLGFSSTRKDEVTAVVDGRPYAIKF